MSPSASIYKFAAVFYALVVIDACFYSKNDNILGTKNFMYSSMRKGFENEQIINKNHYFLRYQNIV